MNDSLRVKGRYTIGVSRPVFGTRWIVIALTKIIQFSNSKTVRTLAKKLRNTIPYTSTVKRGVGNLLTTVGINDMLDKYFSGTSYSVNLLFGLIGSVSTGVSISDTMSSHPGWSETIGYEGPGRNYAYWDSASGGSKYGHLSSGEPGGFLATAGYSIRGIFLTDNWAQAGTTGMLVSAGLLTGGIVTVVYGDRIFIEYTMTLS